MNPYGWQSGLPSTNTQNKYEKELIIQLTHSRSIIFIFSFCDSHAITQRTKK